MKDAYVGFYWTLPSNWADFRGLPADVEGAAEASRTIRYQRERVRHWVRENAGRLVHEIAFMDVRTDRATEVVRAELDRAKKACAGVPVSLLHVQFEQRNLWRTNHHLYDHAQEIGLNPVALSPDPMTIDGRLFDPIRHFETWRSDEKTQMKELRRRAYRGLDEALSEMPEGPGRWQGIAERLNSGGVRSLKGGNWTAENVRKVVQRHLVGLAS